jgi:Putative restriction endonuclease
MSTSPLVKDTKAQATDIETVVSPVQKRNPTIEDFNFREGLPTAEELPCSDDRPVDSELQELIPGLLKAILLELDGWRDRSDWLFGIDMGFYYDSDKPCIAPDGLLSIGLTETVEGNLRSSYLLWHEKVLPLFALEVISKTYGQEDAEKRDIYQSIGILYYLVYAPLRKRKAKYQLYKLVDGEYVLESDGKQPYWMPELGLGIGFAPGIYGQRQSEWLYWYDLDGQRYPTPTERTAAALQKAEEAEQKVAIEATARLLAEQEVDRLRERLRDLGIDPDS